MTRIKVDLVAKSPVIGRSTRDQAIDEGFLEIWRSVPEVFSGATCTVDDAVYRLTLDWSPTLEYLENRLRVEDQGVPDGAERDARPSTTPPEPRILGFAEISNFNEGSDAAARMAAFCLDTLLQEFFLITNVACPGACGGVYETADPLGRIRVESSSGHFYSPWLSEVWVRYRGGKWPLLTTIPLRDARDWYERLGIGTRQVAATRTERAIFSFMHFCESFDLRPDGLMWLAHCLEALYDTPKEGILRSLKERIFLALGQPTNAREWRQRVDTFYEIRSNFVHGELDIVRPRENEILDYDPVTQYWARLEESAGHALALILGTLQELVRNNWERLDFETRLVGVNFEKAMPF